MLPATLVPLKYVLCLDTLCHNKYEVTQRHMIVTVASSDLSDDSKGPTMKREPHHVLLLDCCTEQP
jgi:hypothetical protein